MIFTLCNLKHWQFAVLLSLENGSEPVHTPLQHVSGTTRHLPLYGGCMKDVRAKDTTKVEDRLSLRKLAAREPVVFDVEGFVEQDEEETEVLEIIG